MRLLINYFLFSFDFVVEVLSTSFCTNPDALGFDEPEKGIFDSLKNIARLPLDSPKEGDRLADSAAGSAGDLVLGEAGKGSSATGTGEWFDVDDWFFCRALLMSLYFSDKQTGDRPKSPPSAANVDPIPLEPS